VAADPVKLRARLTVLKGQRSNHEQVWKDCFEYSIPELGSGFNGQMLTAGEVQQRKAQQLDGTAADSMTASADGFMGGMTPANSLWFGLDVDGSQSHEEKSWLAEAAKTIFENIHASNFDAEAYDAVLMLMGAGWFCLYADEDDGGGYYFENWPISQCYIAASRMGGKVDTIYREFEMSAGAAVAEYGQERVSETVRQMVANGRQDETITILHAIEPRQDYIRGSTIAKNLAFASCHMECSTNVILRETGYHEFPVVVPRWRRIPGSAYARGPMCDALPDVKTANEVARWELAAAETVIAPPMVVADDGVINARNIKLGPRKIIVANDVNNIKPLITGAKVEFGQLLIERLAAKIEKTMMADLFRKIIDDPTMTATQVHAILALVRQRMGPRFGRLQAEWLQPLIERCYGLALRAGALGTPPRSLQRRNYTIKYESPLARAQKLEEVSAMEMHETGLLATAATVPDVLDTYKWDDAQRRKAELRGVPMDLVPDEKAVAKLRDDRAAAQQAAQQQQVELAAQTAGAERMAGQLAGA
jgi:hypothetical protein